MNVRDRIKELRRVRASELLPSDQNWRTHPPAQREALRGILTEVGYAGALLARELPDGRLALIDGHLRAEETPDADVPVLVLDVNEAEAAKLLASFDPIGALATADAGKLDELLGEIDTDNRGLAQLLDGLASDNQADTKLKPLSTLRPPAMTWVLLGIPTVRFGEIAATVEQLAAREGVILETSVSDG